MPEDGPRLVKPAQSRHGTGMSAVYVEPAARWQAGPGDVYVKRQRDYFCHPVWRGFRRTPTLRRELRGLRAWHRLGINVPEVVSYAEQRGSAELVLRAVAEAQPLHRALTEPGADREVIIHNLAATLGRLHRAGWVHGALYPQHLLVGPPPAHEIVLIDLEKSRRSRRRRQEDLERFWRYGGHLLSVAEIDAFNETYTCALRGPGIRSGD